MSKELTYLQKLEKDYLRIEAENETLSSANQDLLHEVRVLKNKAENLEHDFMYYFKLANKLDHQIKRYRERVAQLINYIEMTDDETDRQVHKIHVILDGLLEGAE